MRARSLFKPWQRLTQSAHVHLRLTQSHQPIRLQTTAHPSRVPTQSNTPNPAVTSATPTPSASTTTPTATTTSTDNSNTSDASNASEKSEKPEKPKFRPHSDPNLKKIRQIRDIEVAFNFYCKLNLQDKTGYIVNHLLKLWLEQHEKTQHAGFIITSIYNDILTYGENVNNETNNQIKEHLDNERYAEAMALYDTLINTERPEEDKRTDISHIFYLNACALSNQYEKGKQMIDSLQEELTQHTVELLGAIIDYYGNFGKIQEAKQLYKAIPFAKRSIMTVNVLVSVFINAGDYKQALGLLENCKIEWDDVALLLYLKVCAHLKEFAKAQELLDSTVMTTLNRRETDVMNGVIEFYGRLGDVEKAVHVFKTIAKDKKNPGTFYAMLMCFVDNDQYKQAIALFDGDQAEIDGLRKQYENMVEAGKLKKKYVMHYALKVVGLEDEQEIQPVSNELDKEGEEAVSKGHMVDCMIIMKQMVQRHPEFAEELKKAIAEQQQAKEEKLL